MFGYKKRIKALEEKNAALEKEISELKDCVKDLKTISARTSQEDAPVSPSQILDEWLNGAKEEDENG